LVTSYRYKIQRGGSPEVGMLEAKSQQEAADLLRRKGGVVLQLRVDAKGNNRPPAAHTRAAADGDRGAAVSVRSIVNRLLIFRNQVELTLRQPGTLLAAGVPILHGHAGCHTKRGLRKKGWGGKKRQIACRTFNGCDDSTATKCGKARGRASSLAFQTESDRCALSRSTEPFWFPGAKTSVCIYYFQFRLGHALHG
jgi:hypothetical protein